MGKGTSTNTVVQNSQPPQQFLDAYQYATSQAQNIAAQPYQKNRFVQVAPFQPGQEAAFTGVAQGQPLASGLPMIGTAADYVGQATAPIWPNVQQFSPDAVNQYMNPYVPAVVGATEAQFQNQNAIQQNQLVGNAASQGALGGSRLGAAQGVLAGQQAVAQDPILAGLYSSGYGQALQEFNTQQQAQLGATEAQRWLASQGAFAAGQLGQEAYGMSQGQIGDLLNIGGMQQQEVQSALNIPAYNFYAKQAYPFQTTNFMANIAEGAGSLAGGTSSTQYPDPSFLSQIAGLGTAGIGAYGLLNNTGLIGSGQFGLGSSAVGAANSAAAAIPALAATANFGFPSAGALGAFMAGGFRRGGAARRGAGGIIDLRPSEYRRLADGGSANPEFGTPWDEPLYNVTAPDQTPRSVDILTGASPLPGHRRAIGVEPRGAAGITGLPGGPSGPVDPNAPIVLPSQRALNWRANPNPSAPPWAGMSIDTGEPFMPTGNPMRNVPNSGGPLSDPGWPVYPGRTSPQASTSIDTGEPGLGIPPGEPWELQRSNARPDPGSVPPPPFVNPTAPPYDPDQLVRDEGATYNLGIVPPRQLTAPGQAMLPAPPASRPAAPGQNYAGTDTSYDFQPPGQASAAPSPAYGGIVSPSTIAAAAEAKRRGDPAPWLALMAAGFGMMAGRSPNAGANIGAGALEGVKFYEQQREHRALEDLREEEAQARNDWYRERGTLGEQREGRLAGTDAWKKALGEQRESDLTGHWQAQDQLRRDLGLPRLSLEQYKASFLPEQMGIRHQQADTATGGLDLRQREFEQRKLMDVWRQRSKATDQEDALVRAQIGAGNVPSTSEGYKNALDAIRKGAGAQPAQPPRTEAAPPPAGYPIGTIIRNAGGQRQIMTAQGWQPYNAANAPAP